jgi:hypothetical protein
MKPVGTNVPVVVVSAPIKENGKFLGVVGVFIEIPK